MPIGPGAESVRLELYAPDPSASRWDAAVWDGGRWADSVWNAVGCEVLEATYQYGATDEAGVLSLPQAGQLDLSTRDPARVLDPANVGGPFFGSIAPGTQVRVRTSPAAGDLPAWTGYLDSASYDVASAGGKLRAVDGIAYLAQADVPAGTILPNTLRARVRAVVAAVGLDLAVPIEPDVVLAELMTNGSFENGTAPWAFLNTVPPSGTSPLGLGVAPDGARVYRAYTGPGLSGSVYQAFAQPPTPGATYTFGGWVQRISGTGQPSITVRGRNVAGALTGPAVTVTAIGQGGFEYLTGTWTAPADGSVATVYFYFNSPVDYQWYMDAASVLAPVPGSELPADPAVAPFDGKAKPAWQVILDAAQDALVLPWLDATGVLRFRSWGGFPAAPFAIGCGPAAEGPWLAGLRTIDYGASGDAIRNAVRAWSAVDTPTAPVSDVASIARYGQRMLAVDRVVPAFADWSARILADRAGAGLSVDLGEVRPYSVAELGDLLTFGLSGPQVVRVRDEDHPPTIDHTVGAIGALVRVTAAGWSFDLVAMIPRVEWQEVEPPPEVVTPPPGTYHQETRTYIAGSDALLALTSGGSKYGAGAATSLPVGAWSGWTYRACIGFPAIPWTKVRGLVSATLQLDTSDQVRVGFGSSPTIELRRITGGWSAGSASSPSGSNAVVWPGPPTTSTGAVRSNVTRSENAAVNIRVDAIARAWAPSSAGGSGAGQYGIELLEGSGSTADTSEFWPVEKGGASRPQLVLVVDVFD